MDIFTFESDHQNQNSSIETINFNANDPETFITPLNYATARRIEQARTILKNYSLLLFHANEAKEPVSITRMKWKAKLCKDWTPELEKELFSSSRDSSHEIQSGNNYHNTVTYVTPSNNFIDLNQQDSRPSSFTSSFSPSSLKSSPFLNNRF